MQPRVLSTRNFEPLYNVACSLRAFRLLQNRFPDATLTLVGAGSQDAALRDVPIVVLSSAVLPPDRVWSARYGAAAFVAKPASVTAVAGTILRHLPRAPRAATRANPS